MQKSINRRRQKKAISGVLHSILSDELTNYKFWLQRWFRSLQTHRKDDFALVISDIKCQNFLVQNF